MKEPATALPELIIPCAAEPLEELLHREWLLTNGLGGYAAGTVALCNTRKYHGLLIPSLPGLGRTVMLARMDEQVSLPGEAPLRLDGEDLGKGQVSCPGAGRLTGFRLHGLVPEWTFALEGGGELVRRLVLVHGENTLYVSYGLTGGPARTLRVRPYPSFRSHESGLQDGRQPPTLYVVENRVEMRARADTPPLRVRFHSACATPFTALDVASPELFYRVEEARGYHAHERLRSPGYFECTLHPGQTLGIGFTTDGWEMVERPPEELFAQELQRERHVLERAPAAAWTGTAGRLLLAADQFLIEPATRARDEAWAHATGQELRSVIAGYPWFTDWGRDTMISLEGLTLVTGRHREAAAILRTFHHHIRDGLLPNFFPDGNNEGVYHTADATLWFFHALGRYLQASGDLALLRDFFPGLKEVIEHHLEGTRFNIRVDPRDGLLAQGAEGYQLTWMDAKVDGWVVTPRRGKAVEINALWFNALSAMASWAERLGEDPALYRQQAEKARASFNRRFWNPDAGCLFDVVDAEGGGNDASVRPNQIFSVSLDHPVLERAHWDAVLTRVRDALLTPVGLRTLSPDAADYKPRYDGDLRSRDAAYHQGTVWPWLLGHFVDAWLKHHSDPSIGRGLLLGLERHLTQACVGQVGEIFDASPPFHARGCFAQAWSVAEMLRTWLKTDAH